MIAYIQSKTILNKSKRRDEWFLDDYTLNPYSSCSFNCLYCYIRGSKYGFNMAEKLAVKENAVELLDKQLALHSKKGRYGIVVMSSSTDPYLQVEKDLGVTRKLLEVLLKYKFPVHVITKSDLVERDFDLLNEIGKTAILPDDLKDKLPSGVIITFSFSTIDVSIGKIFESGATKPSARLKTLQKATQAGFHSGVSLMPLLPFISDGPKQLEQMYDSFKAAGAKYVMPASLTLFGDNPHDSKSLMMKAIGTYFPNLLPKYNELFNQQLSVPYQYQKELKRKTDDLSARFSIPNKITN